MSSDAGTAASERSIGSVLSRNSVYTTVRSLDDAAAAEQSKTPAATTSSSASFSHKKLLQFYAQLSTAHHHRQSERLDGKNTAARPLSVTDVASRIETRSLTLTGGGYNSTVMTTTTLSKANKNKSSSIPTTTSNRQGKRQRRKLVRRLGAPNWDNGSQTNLHFLLELNAHWNRYISQILSLSNNNNIHHPTGSSNGDKETTEDEESIIRTINLKVRLLVDEIEWIGARVMVQQQQIGHSARQHGILVRQTLHTWRVARLPPSVFAGSSGEANAATTGDTSSNNGNPMGLVGKTVTVPKQPGTSLIVLVPLPLPWKQDSSERLLAPATTGRFLKVILEGSKR